MKVQRAKIINPAAMQFHPIQQSIKMTTANSLNPDMSPVVGAPVLTLLRLEGLRRSFVRSVLYAHRCKLVDVCGAVDCADLSLLGYLVGPNIGARVYKRNSQLRDASNARGVRHVAEKSLLVPIALIWMNHIGVDACWAMA